jgi:replicative DNA helicase
MELENQTEKLELFNIEAEQIILGSMIADNIYFEKVSQIIKAEHFFEPANRAIFERIDDVVRQGIADQVTLKQFFRTDERVSAMGGIAYLSTLLSRATGVVDVADYARLVLELWQKRKLEEILSKTYSNLSLNFDKLKEELEAGIGKIGSETSKEPVHISKLVDSVIDDPRSELLFFDFENLDNLLAGVDLQSLIILGGLPSSGKTTFSLNLARNVAAKNGVLFFSIEVRGTSIARKFLTEQATINPFRLKQGTMNQSEQIGIVSARERTKDFSLLIDDEAGLTISKMRSKIKRMKRKYDVKMIVIDYLQLITPEQKEFSREQSISRISEALKRIAKDFNLVVVALSQLSRAVHGRENKRPILSDLRDSGAIEQNADIVMFVHRDEYFLEREREPEGSKNYQEWARLYEASKGKADVIVAKYRDGQVGDVKFNFDGLHSRFLPIIN